MWRIVLEILMRIALTLEMAPGRVAVFTILVLTPKPGRSFPISFFKSLKFSLFQSFTSFVRFILRYLNVSEAIVIVLAFHRICCDWGLCSPGLFRFCILLVPTAILNKPCCISGLSSPRQKSHLLVSPTRAAMASSLSCSTAHLSLVFFLCCPHRCPHSHVWA